MTPETSLYLWWKDLVCGYRGREPLNLPFSGQLNKSGIYAILGPNGSGKSTLMRTWLGLIPSLAGTVRLLKTVDNSAPLLGYVPQYHCVNPWFHISVRDLIAQGIGTNRITKSEEQHITSLLDAWELQNEALRSFHELSMGQKTRALVARALVAKPRLLFLDEPLASLDIHCQNFLMNSLLKLSSEESVCILMIDHHLENFKEKLTGRFVFERAHYRNTCAIRLEQNSPFHGISAHSDQQYPQ